MIAWYLQSSSFLNIILRTTSLKSATFSPNLKSVKLRFYQVSILRRWFFGEGVYFLKPFSVFTCDSIFLVWGSFYWNTIMCFMKTKKSFFKLSIVKLCVHFMSMYLCVFTFGQKPSKWLKMHFFGHKGNKIFIIQPLRGIFIKKWRNAYLLI